MPSDECVGTHNRQQIAPFEKSRQEDERDARRIVSPSRQDPPFEVACEQFPEEQVLGCQLRAGSGHEPQEEQQVSEESERRLEHVCR
jgi:hypothetical protein